MVSRVTYADGSSLHYAYDKAGNLIRETDTDGGITRYTYDLLGQVTNILSADGTVTEYEYDADGEVVSELVRNIAFSDENETEGHYSNLVNTSSKPFVANAIRNVEDAFDSSKGSSFPKPVSKTPTSAKPKTPAQEYADARRQATIPTQAEYIELRKSGINMSYGQYANDKQQTRFPSYDQYMYDKQQGKNFYHTYGPLQSTTGQINHIYDRTPNIAANTTPKVESVNPKLDYYCDVANRIPDINALGAGNYDGIGDAIEAAFNLLKKLKSLDDSYRAGYNSVLIEKIGQPLIDIIGAMEKPFNERMPAANYLYSKKDALLRNLERNVESSTAYNLGKVLTDIEAIAVDLSVFKGSGEAAKIIITGIKGGEVIAATQISAGTIKAVAGVVASADGFGNGTNLGNDLKDLIEAIKGTGSTNLKWGNPKSTPTYGHTFTEHGQKQTSMQLTDRARSLNHQVGQWLDDQKAADYLADIAKNGEGVYNVNLPASIKGRSFLPDGTEVSADMARVIVKPDGSIRTAFPYCSLYE